MYWMLLRILWMLKLMMILTMLTLFVMWHEWLVLTPRLIVPTLRVPHCCPPHCLRPGAPPPTEPRPPPPPARGSRPGPRWRWWLSWSSWGWPPRRWPPARVCWPPGNWHLGVSPPLPQPLSPCSLTPRRVCPTWADRRRVHRDSHLALTGSFWSWHNPRALKHGPELATLCRALTIVCGSLLQVDTVHSSLYLRCITSPGYCPLWCGESRRGVSGLMESLIISLSSHWISMVCRALQRGPCNWMLSGLRCLVSSGRLYIKPIKWGPRLGTGRIVTAASTRHQGSLHSEWAPSHLTKPFSPR